MGNKSSSVSLEEERRANDPAATQSPAKASFRETLFKHRKSFRESRALNKSSVKAREGPEHDEGSTVAPADILGSSSARAAAFQGHSTSSTVPVPCGAVQLAAADASAVSCRADSRSSSGGPMLQPAELVALGTSEPTYEEIRTGASPGDATTFVHSSRLQDVDRSSGGLAGQLSSSSDATAEASSKLRATVGVGSGESIKGGGSSGSRLRVVLGSLFPPGKKSKKKKSSGGHGNDPSASDPSSVGEAGRPSSHSSGSSRQSGRQSGQLDCGGDVQQAKSCGDRGGDAEGPLTATHRRAASYERQLPNLPIGQSSGSDETIPKRRCSEDDSPKLRRALPDIPHELPSPVDCVETVGDQIYSDVTDVPPPSGVLLSSAPPVSAAVSTTADDDAYDEIQRDRNPASVKADHLTYAAVDELTAAVSSCVVSTDGTYDMLQRDKNPLSVKIQQLKLNNGKDADDDQYSKALETPPFGSTLGVDSGEIYCEADAVEVAVVTSTSGTVGVSAGCGPALVVGSDRSSGAATICSSQVGPPLSAGECCETRTSGASSSAAAGGLNGSALQHPPPYSIIKPVSPAVAAARVVDRHASLTPTDVDPAVDTEPPRVPEKRFDICDNIPSIDGIAQPHALESSAAVVDDDDSELYSLPIETSAAASTAAGCSNSGDLPAGYGIITLREPLSVVQERLAAGDCPIANADESDYYESVDKVDPSGVILVSGLTSDREPGLVVPSLAGTESDAAEVYAVPDELVNADPGSAGLPPIPPPVPQGARRRQAASAYEEITFPAEGNTRLSADASSGRTGLKCASLPAGGFTRTSGDMQPAVAAERNTGTGASQLRSRRCGYEEVDLPATSAAKPVANGSHESAATVTAVGGDTCVLFIPPPASDRPLARPLANRGRLAHHYEEVDKPDDGGRPATSLKIAGARQPHLYDEIEDIVQQRT